MSTPNRLFPRTAKMAKATPDWIGRAIKWSIPWLVPALAIALWQTASQTGLLSSRVLPAPTAVLKAAFRLSKSGELLSDVRASTLRVALGFLIGSLIGLCLGILSGQFRLIANLIDGTLQMIRNIPHLAVLPLVILWFGIGEEAKILLVVLGVFFPIYLNAYHGVRNVDQQLIEMARIYGLRGFALFRHVTLPGALPSIMVGFRYALGIAWLTLIVAETIASTSGIGHLAMGAREFMQTDVVVLTILLYALLGKMSDSTTKMLERRFLQWNPAYRR